MFSTEQVLLEHTDITSIVGCRSINGGLGGKQCSPAWSINYEEFMTNILQVHRCTAWSYDEQYFKNRKTLNINMLGRKTYVTSHNLWLIKTFEYFVKNLTCFNLTHYVNEFWQFDWNLVPTTFIWMKWVFKKK